MYETIELAPDLTIVFVRVPGGPFVMGSEGKADALPGELLTQQEAKYDFSLEAPQHEVHLTEYLISQAPITRAQYERVRSSAGLEEFKTLKSSFLATGPDVAVGGVNWVNALGFCTWCTDQSGLKISLPSEAQWEKAARGTDSRHYPWGNDPPTNDHCYFAGIGSGPKPVNQKSPLGDSPYGCTDMLGNVGEWCNSVLAKYPFDADDGREVERHEGPVWRVIRGMPSFKTSKLTRSAARFSHLQTVNPFYIGFRIVVDS